MALGRAEGLAKLSLPDVAENDGALLHPGLLDLATGWAIELAPVYEPSTLWVPVSYGAIRVLAPLTKDIYSHVRLSDGQTEQGAVLFDITLCDPAGKVLVEISHFRMQQLSGSFSLLPTRTDTTAAALGLTSDAETQPLSPDERRLLANLENGIHTSEGGIALERALAAGLPQVVVSSLDLDALRQQADTSGQTAPEGEGQSFDRPDLDTDYVAPRTATEEALAGHFATLLGLSQIGVEDSFFDLGGHSLIAVRLFAQIKRSFGVELPMSVLFDAPTVAALATRIEAETGPRETQGDATDNQEATPQSFSHLVRLAPGKDNQAAPMFIVAGMFGNVLNLRHLAQILGEDRPVYGLQARGLIGTDEPHERIEDAARAYIAEMRQVQPEGPYLIGGFSGGGITAYEIAQQLNASGEAMDALVLLDTPLPVRPDLKPIDKALIKLAEIRSKGPGFLGEWLRNRIAWEIRKRHDRPAETGESTGFNNRKIELAFLRAVAAYEVQPWTGPVTLYRPVLDRHWKVSGGQWVSRDREYVYADNDWTRFAPSLIVREVPGDHDGMVLVPNVSVLGKEIRDLLGQSARQSAGPQDISKAAE